MKLVLKKEVEEEHEVEASECTEGVVVTIDKAIRISILNDGRLVVWAKGPDMLYEGRWDQ